MRHDVGIGDIKASKTPGDIIKTYALGSCVAVMMYDPQRKIGGMIHVALPEASTNPEKARKLPGYFADTGLPVLLEEMQKLGCPVRSLKVKIAGGASIMDDNNTFDIGRRNAVAVKRFLWKNGLGVLKEDIGGKISRTVSLHIDSGEITVSNAKTEWKI